MTHEIYDLSQGLSKIPNLVRTGETKLKVLLVSGFLYLSMTTFAGYVFQEVVSLLILSFQLPLNTNRQTSMSYVFKCSLLILITLGVLVCFAQILDDVSLTLLLSSVVWCCELFAVTCVRSRESMGFFPHMYFIYLFTFFLYLLQYPFGYTNLAFFTLLGFIEHAMLFTLFRYEIPAILNGDISIANQRYNEIPRHS